MIRLYVLFAALLAITACTAPVVEQSSDTPRAVLPEQKDIERLLLEAERSLPPRSTELRLRAASLAMLGQESELTTRILASVDSPYITDKTTTDYSFLKSELALLEGNPREAVRLLDDERLQAVPLTQEMQVRAGRLRADAYFMGRSYLASARELIYINRLLTPADRPANHEKIFSTLLMLPGSTLESQAQQRDRKSVV